MSRTPEPLRLLSRAPKDSEVRLALAAAQRREPGAAELQALSASIFGALADGAGAPNAGAFPAASPTGAAQPPRVANGPGGVTLAKMGALLVTLVLVAAATWWSFGRSTQKAPPPNGAETSGTSLPPSRSESAVPRGPEPEASSLAPLTEGVAELCTNPPCSHAQAQAQALQKSPRRSGARPPGSTSALERRTTAATSSELQLIDDARQALRASPARALTLADQHEQQFPRGSMAEEREVIRISALAALGQTSRAEAMAREFLRTHSGSAYAPRVEAVLSSR